MKTTIKSLLILAAIAALFSCESIKELADVEFDTTVSNDLNIKVDDSELKSAIPAYSFDTSAVLDPTSDPEVKKYADKIKKYQVTSIKATVSSVSKENVKLMQGTWFKIHDASDEAMWTLPGDFDVVVNNSYTLGNENGQWDAVQRILGRNASFTVSTEGHANTNHITIVLDISIGATVTANPL